MSDRRYRVGVVLVGAVALTIRMLNVALTKGDQRLWGDAFDYFTQARALLQGYGFMSVLTAVKYSAVAPTAAHPPGFIVLLAFLRRIGIDTPLGQRYAMCVIGTATVLIIVLCVARLLGRRGGLIAGFIAALYPQMWINDGMLMSETLFVFGFALGVYGVYGYFEDRHWARLAFASLGFTLAASARAESLLLFPIVLVPLILMRRHTNWKGRIGHLAIAAVFPLLMTVPWYLYNSTRFAEPVLYTTGLGRALQQGNCPKAYWKPYIGSYVVTCLELDPPPPPPPGNAPDESKDDAYFRAQSIAYMKGHKSMVPKVMLAREGRVWGLWWPHQQNTIDHYYEGRGSMTLVTWAQRSYWVLGLLAIAGLWCLRRRRIPIYPLLGEVAITALVAAATFGNTRYRAAVEVCIVILAAAAIDFAWGRRSPNRSAGAENGDPDPLEVRAPAGGLD